jgi:hypothetical protein
MPLLHLDELDQVPAGVVEHDHPHRPGIHRLHREGDAEVAQPAVLGIDVVDPERGRRNPVGDQRVLVRLDGGMTARLQQQLRSLGGPAATRR